MERALSQRKLLTYRPYSKQRQFHAAGSSHRERLFMAMNQGGKTLAGGMETAVHCTGLYPADWKGRRFEKPVRSWVAGISNEQTRDNAQRMLIGPPEKVGTGTIPADRIADIVWSRGINNFVDMLFVRHSSGGLSSINFKSYEMGRKKWQGETLDLLWCDEEPPLELYTEALARITATKGFIFITFTPLMGMTEVVEQFYPTPNHTSRHITRMEIEDVASEPHGHISPAQVEEIVSSYPAHEREARAKGIPVLGSGRVFPVAESMVACDPFDIPSHWRRVAGIDFGWDHPTAIVHLAYNADSDVIYLYYSYKQSEQTPVFHAAALKSQGDWIPVAWPHDGYQHDKGSGLSLAHQYVELGVRMIPEHAQFESGGFGVEAGIMDLLDRMKTGRFKVFSTSGDWMEEFRRYHRKDGKIVARHDDLMSATRYAAMSLRYARPQAENAKVYQTSVGMDFDPLSAAVGV